jgi:hypothetical protein
MFQFWIRIIRIFTFFYLEIICTGTCIIFYGYGTNMNTNDIFMNILSNTESNKMDNICSVFTPTTNY